MLNAPLRVERLSATNRQDFFKVLSMGTYGDCCYCVFWWVPTRADWDVRTCDQNRETREVLFEREEYDGYILYIRDEPQGWCQAVERDRLPGLQEKYGLNKEAGTWAITCFNLNPQITGNGLSHQFLALVLQELKNMGVKRVQAFPKNEKGLSKDEIWPGPISIYQKAGFEMIRQDEHRPILEKLL